MQIWLSQFQLYDVAVDWAVCVHWLHLPSCVAASEYLSYLAAFIRSPELRAELTAIVVMSVVIDFCRNYNTLNFTIGEFISAAQSVVPGNTIESDKWARISVKEYPDYLLDINEGVTWHNRLDRLLETISTLAQDGFSGTDISIVVDNMLTGQNWNW